MEFTHGQYRAILYNLGCLAEVAVMDPIPVRTSHHTMYRRNRMLSRTLQLCRHKIQENLTKSPGSPIIHRWFLRQDRHTCTMQANVPCFSPLRPMCSVTHSAKSVFYTASDFG